MIRLQNKRSRAFSMRSRIFFIILACLALPLTGNASPGDVLVISPEMQYEYALKCFTQEDYETAVVEFKRFIHFFPDDGKITQARFNTGMALYRTGRFHEAARVFNEIILAHDSYDLTMEACFMQADAFLKIQNHGYAEIVLQNILMMAEDVDTKDRAYGKLADIYLEKAQNMEPDALDAARVFLDKISAGNDGRFHKQERIKLIEAAQNANQKDPTLAGIFSVIPGMGFLYCERYHDAFITFCLNAGLILSACKAHENSNDALAGVIAFVETGFYSGNIYGAITAAHKYNKALRLSIFNQNFSVSSEFDPVMKGVALSLTRDF